MRSPETPAPPDSGQNLFELGITDLDDEGFGVGVAGERTIHVGGAVPGDVARCRLLHQSPHRPHSWASLEAIATPSPNRVPARCPHGGTGRCGGCVLQSWDYAEQLGHKAGRVAALLAGLGAENSALAPIRPSPDIYGYRNQVKLVVEGGQPLRLGAYAPGSHDVTDMLGCAAPEPCLAVIIERLPGLLDRAPVEPFNPATCSGSLRYVLLRANARGQVLVTLVTWPGRRLDGSAAGSPPARPAHIEDATDDVAKLGALLAQAHPEIVGVLHNENGATSGRLLGKTTRLVTGLEHLEDAIGHAQILVSSSAFLQANRKQAQNMYQEVLAQLALTKTDVVIDAYAGVGSIAFFLAPCAKQIVAIEANQEACRDAEVAAKTFGVSNVTVVCADASRGLAAETSADALVLNPPRKGCAPKVIGEVLRIRPARLVYVSCNPQTFARDAGLLMKDSGYHLTAVTPFDLFPHTPHIELVATFRQRRW